MSMRSRGRVQQSMSDDPPREVTVFIEALKVSVHERPAFLQQACAGDEKLRQKVEALLRVHDRLGNFLEEPPTGGPSSETN